MQIRNKLAFYFTVTSSLLMLVIMSFIYLLFTNLTKKNFYKALHDRTEVAAQLYLEADEISDAALQKIKEKYVISLPSEIIRLYDSTNKLSFVKDTDKNWNNNIIEEVRKKKYIAYQDKDRQVVGIYYEDNQGNFVILASAADTEGREQRKNLLQIMAILFGIQILIQFGAGRWFAQRALRPVQIVNAQVQKITATDLHLRVDTENEKDELGQLAANFNSLLERLEKSFDLQKMFVANASHELKTPVTNMIGELEVTLHQQRSAADYQKTLQSVLVETERLHEIIRNFLMLSNAENNVAMQKTEFIRLDELLWEIKELFNGQKDAQIEILLDELPADDQRLYLATNKTLLMHVLTNILQNAIKFSSGKPVTCGLHFTPASVSISISDKGVGINPELAQKIFEPFFRITADEHVPGHGIGLYIASKIVLLLGGTITVQSEPGKGSTFNIIFEQKAGF